MQFHWDLCIINSFYELCCLTLVYSDCKVMLNFRKISYERDFSTQSFSLPYGLTETCRTILCMGLIEIPVLRSKLSSSFSWKVVICNYRNHTLNSSGAVKYSRAGQYTYWLEMSCSHGRTDVSEMSPAEQNAIVVLWYLWLPFYRKYVIKQSKKDADGKYLCFLIYFVFIMNLLQLIVCCYCCYWVCCSLHARCPEMAYCHC